MRFVLRGQHWDRTHAAPSSRASSTIATRRFRQLSRAPNDVTDLAHDLEEVGFEKKNIEVLVDPRSGEDFNKFFGAFVSKVEPGDSVLFFFSGHSFSVDETSYLLPADVKSPYAYSRPEMTIKQEFGDKEVREKGLSFANLEQKIFEHKPKTAIVVLDVCNALLAVEGAAARDEQHRNSGCQLSTGGESPLPPEYLLFFSAGAGERAVENVGGDDRRRNSLFVEVLRSELQRPGQSLEELAERVAREVRAVAELSGRQQEPAFLHKRDGPDKFLMGGSIGRERFQSDRDRCLESFEDWEQIRNSDRRELFETYRRRFASCPTAESCPPSVNQYRDASG